MRRLAFAIVLCFALPAAAEEPLPMTELRLDILPVLDSTPRRFVFVIGGVAYDTLDGLKGYIEAMPKDRVLVLDPGCLRMGGEPLISSEEEMSAFRAFTKKHGVTLKIIPSG